MKPVWLSMLTIPGAIAMLGCGGSTHFEDLEQPALWWEQRLGMCSRVVAVDADRAVWNDQGCEDGDYSLGRVGVTTQERYSSVLTASALLPDPPEQMSECPTGCEHVFKLLSEGHQDRWIACGTGTAYGDLSGLDEPFLSLAMAFQDLP